MGYEGDLPTRCAEWESSCTVPAEEVPEVIARLMSEA